MGVGGGGWGLYVKVRGSMGCMCVDRCVLLVTIYNKNRYNTHIHPHHTTTPLSPPNPYQVFSEKHASDKREKWVTGNFHFFRMHRITDIYFVGGFGTLQWVNAEDYINAEPDLIVLDNPDRTIQMMNERFSEDLRALLSPGTPLQDAHIISVDRLGADVRVRKGLEYSVQRVGFREV